MMLCQIAFNRNPDVVWPVPYDQPLPLSSPPLPICLSLFLFLSESEAPQYTLAPHTQCGRCWCEKAPLLNSDSQCTIIPPLPRLQHSPHSPSPPTIPLYFTECVSLSILYPCILFPSRKVRGTFQTKDEKLKLRVWKRQHTSHSLFEAIWSRWQGRKNEVEIHIVQRVFKFQESVQFQYYEFMLNAVFQL